MDRAAPTRRAGSAVGRPTRNECFLGVAVLAADQLTKHFTQNVDCRALVCPLSNPGLMLGIVRSEVDVVLVSLSGLSLFACWVCALARRVPISWFAVVLVVAGVVGNAIDRLTLGFVRDFVVVPGNAVLNIADLVIAFGLMACALPLLTHNFARTHRRGGELS